MNAAGEVTAMDKLIVLSVSVGACIFLVYFLAALWRDVNAHKAGARVELKGLTLCDDSIRGGSNLLRMPSHKTIQPQKQGGAQRAGR